MQNFNSRSRVQPVMVVLTLLILGGCHSEPQQDGAAVATSPSTEGVQESESNGDLILAPVISIIDAASTGNVDAIKQHIAAGTNIESRSLANASTPLNVACAVGRTDVVEVLLDAGADIESKNSEQTTPLFNAAFFCHPLTVELLLKRKANVNTTDKNGMPLVEVMKAPWEIMEGLYKAIYPAVGLEYDAEQIKAARPEILKMLQASAGKLSNAAIPIAPKRSKAEIESVRKSRPPITDADWATYNHDIRGWRFNSAEKTLTAGNASKLREKWRFPESGSSLKVGAIHGTPTVVNGHVYFGTATYPAYYKLKPDGSLAWVYRIGSEISTDIAPEGGVNHLSVNSGVVTSALVTQTAVYFGNSAGVFFALDRVTGEELWKVNTRAEGFPNHHSINVFNASAILADGLVIVGGGGYEHPYPLDPEYECCTGRGFVVAFNPDNGDVVWKYEVGEKPKKFLKPIPIEDGNGKHVFTHGPSTSSVWSTPSCDEATGTIFFGTDVHNSPRQPTDDDPRLYTKYSAAVIAVDGKTGKEKWVTQVNEGDIFNHTMSGYDPVSKRYKDCSIGDTAVVGVGCKNGGFYVMRADNGQMLAQTPVYEGEPKYPLSPQRDPRTLALPSAIGGLQTGCATDGSNVYTNGIDWLSLNTKMPGWPEAGRVVSVSGNLSDENWRHERPGIQSPLYTGGDPVGAGIALAEGLACFTPTVSEKLVLLDTNTGKVLNELPVGVVWSGPSISRGRVYVGTGSVLFLAKQETGSLISFGLPGEDEIDRMGSGDE